MSMSDIVRGEFVEMSRFERVEHPHVPHRQGDRGVRFALEQADGLPAWRVVLLGDAALEPDGRARDQKRMQARRVARTFVEQILQTPADFDREDIDERVRCRAPEPEPQPIGKRAHPCRSRNLERGSVVFRGRTGARLEPDALSPRIGHFEPRRRLWPGPDAFTHETVECLKTHHF